MNQDNMSENDQIESTQPELRELSVINPFLGFLINNWQLILLGLIISGAATTYYVQKGLIAHYKKAYKTEAALVEQYKIEVNTLVTTITDQNEKIQKFHEDAKAKDVVIKDLQKAVVKKEADLVSLRKKLDTLPTPKTCDESLKYLDQTVDLIQW